MNKIRIVICDNDEDELDFAIDGFNKSGLFEILKVVESGDELINLLNCMRSDELPDLILSDLNMPGKNGYDVLEYLRGNPQFSSIPIFISSTSFSQTTKDKCSKLGARDYMVKPDNFSMYKQFAVNLYKKIVMEYSD